MKRRIAGLILAGIIVLTGCGTANEKVDVASEMTEEANAQLSETQTEESLEVDDALDEGGTYEEPSIINIFVENPSLDYYVCGKDLGAASMDISLKKVDVEIVDFADQDAFFSNRNVAVPTFPYTIDNQISFYLTTPTMLEVNDLYLTNDTLIFDFSDFEMVGDIKPGDEAFVEQEVVWAEIVDEILYVEISHYTYAESCPQNAYLMAIDMNSQEVLWKSRPLIANARSFAVVGDYIVSGYGFTAEKDYLYVVDRYNGTVAKEIPLEKAAELITYEIDKLYVRTYDRGIVYEVTLK